MVSPVFFRTQRQFVALVSGRQLSPEELTRLMEGRVQMPAWLDDLLAPLAQRELAHRA